jgi:hypothetical protein
MPDVRVFLVRNRTMLAVGLPVVLIALWAAFRAGSVQAQSYAQIGANSPLPVFVTNTLGQPALPEGFGAGSRWKFTTWTTPSVITWTASVNKTSGAWANLTITDERTTTTRWYYVPAMPGSWEAQ